MLLETYYFNADQSPHGGDQQYILANGDTTGYGLHADLCVYTFSYPLLQPKADGLERAMVAKTAGTKTR